MVPRLACAIVLAALFAAPASAGQTKIKDYATAQSSVFWEKLYPSGGQGVYCNTLLTKGEGSSIEHAFPAHWIAESFGCLNHNNCPLEEYGFAEADLHNLWPAISNINSSRGKLPLGELPGDTAHRFQDICQDYERSSGQLAVVEPRDQSKGDLARSILYMATTYNLSPKGSITQLIQWHKDDPPSDHEKSRNDKIEELQDTRNPFIDHPELAETVNVLLTRDAF